MKVRDKEDKASWGLFWFCFIIYAIVSMSKSVFSASIASIISEGYFEKSQAGIINSGFYLLYGGAQLLGGRFLDKASPMKLLTISILGPMLSVILMGLSDNFYIMMITWMLNGLIQFALWPAILRILTEYLLPMHRQKAMTYISFAYCVGMLFNYFLAAVVLEFSSWRTLFFVEAAMLFLVLLMWILVAGKMIDTLKEARKTYKPLKSLGDDKAEKKEKEPEKESTGIFKLLVKSGAIILLIPAFIKCCLDLGVKTWVPTMIMESYSGVSASLATMLTAVLVVVNLLGVYVVDWIYPKYIKNAVSTFAVCFVISLPFAALMLLIGKISVWLIIVMLMVITTMMYAVNRLLTITIPSFFTEYGRAGSISAILNAAASFGAVISNYGYGLLAEKFGWNGTIISWVTMAVVAVVLTYTTVPMWKKFTNEK